MMIRRSGLSSMCAPIRCRNSASSTTSGSVAALRSTVFPSASTAVSRTVSVAPTLGYGRSMRAPYSRDARAMMPAGPASTSAPSARSAATWKSTGRRPIGSPPTSGTNASPVRCSSGPSIRIGIRFSPVNASGTRGWTALPGATVMSDPERPTSYPMASSIAAVMSTSPTSGALRIVLGPSPSIAATMCLVTAFFDPRTPMSPRSGPDGSTCQVSVTKSQ